MNIAVSRQLVSLYRLWLCAVLSVDAFICGILSVYSFYICVAIMAVSTLSAAFIAFFYIPRYYHSYLVEITETALIIRRGVFIKRKYILPCPRMIYFDRTQNIADRIFGLYSVRVHAARAKLMVPGLSRNEAIKLTMLLSGESER
ncbi:MAG: PH domain-containing protein [Clostridia bacterium]|nr:PH domain-containing protein [Clostridia bacterium]